jgi:hypothetical protein
MKITSVDMTNILTKVFFIAFPFLLVTGEMDEALHLVFYSFLLVTSDIE